MVFDVINSSEWFRFRWTFGWLAEKFCMRGISHLLEISGVTVRLTTDDPTDGFSCFVAAVIRSNAREISLK